MSPRKVSSGKMGISSLVGVLCGQGLIVWVWWGLLLAQKRGCRSPFDRLAWGSGGCSRAWARSGSGTEGLPSPVEGGNSVPGMGGDSRWELLLGVGDELPGGDRNQS